MLYVSSGIGRVMVIYCGGFLPKIHIHLALRSHTNEVTSCLRGGKPGNPALITAYDTVLLSSFNTVNYYIITRILRVIFFLSSSFPLRHLPTHLYTTNKPRSPSRHSPCSPVSESPSGWSTALYRIALLPARVRTYVLCTSSNGSYLA